MEAYEVLEQKFGDWVDNPNCVACSSGTSALHLALEALQLSYSTDVVVPEFTMVACARAVTLAGLRPTFVDCNECDLLLDITKLEQSVRTYTSAIMSVHVYGRRCDMDFIAKLAAERKLKIVEDLAEAHGLMPHPYTDAACWSFYKNKIIHGEEGGMVAFKDSECAALARQLRNLGFTEKHDFNHLPRGVNARLSDAHAKLILESFAQWKHNHHMRCLIEAWYDELVPEEWHMPARNICWVYDLCLPPDVDTCSVVEQLNQEGIAARQAFKPMSEQVEYQGLSHTCYKDLVAYKMSRRVIYLPVQPRLYWSDIQERNYCEHVVQQLTAAVSLTSTG